MAASKESNVLEFFKSRNVKSPSRAYPTDAGIDFFVPKFNKEFVGDFIKKNPSLFKDNVLLTDIFKYDADECKAYINLQPHKRVLIPSGIHSKMALPNRALIAANKSGVASKYGLIFGAQVVDYSYKGEIHINVINTSDEEVRIYEDQKIIQFIETPIFTSSIKVFEENLGELGYSTEGLEDFYKDFVDDRGSNGFGSTNNKK